VKAPNLKTLDVGQSRITDDGLPALVKTDIGKVNLRGCYGVSGPGIDKLDEDANHIEAQREDVNVKGKYKRRMQIYYKDAP
jgi:hypothetical protein